MRDVKINRHSTVQSLQPTPSLKVLTGIALSGGYGIWAKKA